MSGNFMDPSTVNGRTRTLLSPAAFSVGRAWTDPPPTTVNERFSPNAKSVFDPPGFPAVIPPEAANLIGTDWFDKDKTIGSHGPNPKSNTGSQETDLPMVSVEPV